MAGVPPPRSIPPIPSHMMQPPQPGIPPFPMGLRPPLMPVPGMMMPGAMTMPPLPSTLSAPPVPNTLTSGDAYISAKPYTKPVSVADMKANTTVFVGNITDKANDSLVRQILLRCGYIVGWKRVQNATGKLQAFGFCEYADPECTLRAMRLLNNFRLGDKNLVVKVDSKNKKELLKYLTKKTKLKSEENIDDEEIEKEVEQLLAKEEANPFEQELDDEMKTEDKKILDSINTLVKENINVLSGEKSSEDVRREHDVNESLLAMAKQSGRLDEDTTLDDVDMEEDMKTLVSDEIKKFRKSYQDYEEKQAEERLKRTKERRDKDGGDHWKSSPSRISSRSRSPRVRSRSPRRRRSRSPRTHSQERRDRAKEREQRKKEERERMLKEEEEYEQRQLERKKRDREKAYLKYLEQWEVRERRKNKEYKYTEEEEEERREKMERERKCLAEFLEDYDDEKDDHRFYKGSVYYHRRNERDLEIEEDKRDRKREKEELETLRLEVMERQLREIEEEKRRKKEEEEAKGGWTETITDTHSKPKNRNEDEEEEMAVVVKPEVDESLPLTKPGYNMGSGFVPIQVQAAPAVNAPPIKPEIKSNPNEETTSDISLVPYGPPPRENGDLTDSPLQSSSKLTFELGKKSSKSSRVNIEGVFGTEEEKDEAKPKKKLYTLTSSSKGSQFTAAMAEMPHGGVVTADDRKKLIQSLVNSIPSKREELFHWDLRWNQIDQNLMEKRVAPWINKKIVEYIGEPEPTLTDFICNKLAEHVSAEDILKDIAMVLDDEAEVFVLKLWRLLIYETEARHLGIAKNY